MRVWTDVSLMMLFDVLLLLLWPSEQLAVAAANVDHNNNKNDGNNNNIHGTTTTTTTGTASPEQLFRRAASKWQASSGQNNYRPFDQLAIELKDLFAATASTTTTTSQDNNNNNNRQRLEIIGAMEESILLLERYIFEQDHGRENLTRDQTLSQLYTIYATALSLLTPIQCNELTMDPHTLLIGNVDDKNNNSNKLCLENADNAARNAATLDATNEQAEALLKQLNSNNNGGVHERKPKEFVAELFDSFADTFDQKLLHNLEYRVPQLVGNLTKHFSTSYKNALDAGCGTGLAGRYLRPLVEGQLIGVDASSKMLEIASKCTLSKGCGIVTVDDDDEEEETNDKQQHHHQHENDVDDPPLYDDLIVMDLEDMTIANTLYRNNNNNNSSRSTAKFDLIVAADVLVYFGSLENLISTFASISDVGAVLIFSCEKATLDEAPLGWRLLPSGRFAHTKDHAIEVAQAVGYHLEYYQDIVPRMEKGEPVKGHLFGFVLQTSTTTATTSLSSDNKKEEGSSEL